MISLDTETTGVDLRHGALPFLVTATDSEGNTTFWEWEVDPYTREPMVPVEDLVEIRELIDTAYFLHGGIVLQNAKFDITAIIRLFDHFKHESNVAEGFEWPWHCTHDTLLMSHILSTNTPHDLTSLAFQYLRFNIEPYEQDMEVACTEARRIARKQFKNWRIANKELEDMPSAKDKCWKYDTWLPKLIAEELRYFEGHSWYDITSKYANMDSLVTVNLYDVLMDQLQYRKLDRIYNERIKIIRPVYEIENKGVTINSSRTVEMIGHYEQESQELEQSCLNIARNYGCTDLHLPKGGANDSLKNFVFNVLHLPPISYGEKTGKPGLDASTLAELALICEAEDHLSDKARFFKSLMLKRKRDTSISYLKSYQRYGLDTMWEEWKVLHPSLNPTGTDTLRFSSNNPNSQNASKQGDDKGRSIRYCFGPPPGKEWWSMDAQNIELRIPAFESGEETLCDVFLHPDEPPYYGSYHLVVFDVLYPDLFKEYGKKCKTLYEDTLYQWVKNGNFALIYGAQKLTADRTYHYNGAYELIRNRFPKITELSERMIDQANEYGYVETIPDREVDPDRGYPVRCSRSEYGSVNPTLPLNYHVQSTACWWTMRAMIKCQALIDSWSGEDTRHLSRRNPFNKGRRFDCSMVLQVHDELVFEMPRGLPSSPRTRKGRLTAEYVKEHNVNSPRVLELAKAMSSCGDGIGVPTPVGIEYHPHNWAESVVL